MFTNIIIQRNILNECLNERIEQKNFMRKNFGAKNLLGERKSDLPYKVKI